MLVPAARPGSGGRLTRRRNGAQERLKARARSQDVEIGFHVERDEVRATALGARFEERERFALIADLGVRTSGCDEHAVPLEPGGGVAQQRVEPGVFERACDETGVPGINGLAEGDLQRFAALFERSFREPN